MDIAKMVCSDCKASYYAQIVEQDGRYLIGEKVEAPKDPSKCRTQRMLCGDCQGKGGSGDQLNDILRRQRGGIGMGDFGRF